MNRRDKFFKAIRREEEGYVPFEFNLCPSLLDKFKAMTGHENYQDYYRMPMRFIGVKERERPGVFDKYFTEKTEGFHIDHWGVGHQKGSLEHFSRMIYPMESFKSLEDFKNFPYPHVDKDYLWEELPQRVQELKDRDLIVVAGMAITIFEIAWYLRGMDRFMMDLILEEDLAEYHLDRITSIRSESARSYAESGVDILHLGDDVATQRDMMMSPDLWRKQFKFRLKSVIDAAREVNPDILIDYHSDGNVTTIVPDLIEIGVDILNPVQPECMDPIFMKETYGDRLSFRGTIGTQTTMPFGSPEDVKETTKRMIDIVGKGGGLIIAPTHLLEPEVPWENIEALVEVLEDYR